MLMEIDVFTTHEHTYSTTVTTRTTTYYGVEMESQLFLACIS